MADRVYNDALRAIAAGEFDLNADDIRIRLEMSNTTYDTENDGMVNLADFTTNDPCDGANYVDKALASEAVTTDDPNDRAEFTADPVTWTALGVGTRTTVGILIYKYVDGTDANDFAIAFIDIGPITHDGSDFTVTWNAQGILQFSSA